jgi:aminocarboxymuconate-semialdehyde decarboxylase
LILRKINFHSHVYPKVYLHYLSTRVVPPKLTPTRNGYGGIDHSGYLTPLSPKFYNIEKHIEGMDKSKISIDVISLANPWLDAFPPSVAVPLAKEINNEIAGYQSRHPERIVGLATLPLTDVSAARDELRRAINDLGLRGFIMGTNINGESSSAKRFVPILSEAIKLNVPIFLHPTSPGGYSNPPESYGMEKYAFVRVLGFVFDTTLHVSKMIFNGMLERLPHLKLVAAHLGGTLPYLAGRLDRAYYGVPECRKFIKKPPSQYLKKLYFDSVSFSPISMRCGFEFSGEDKILFGTDYPFDIGSNREVDYAISGAGISGSAAEKIYNENASRLLKL